MIPAFVFLAFLAGPDGQVEQTSPETFRILVAPIPAPATPGTFPPRAEDVLEAWNARNLSGSAQIEWHDITSIPWTRVAWQMAIRKPAAVIGDYDFLSATIGEGSQFSPKFLPYLTWVSPKPRQTACLLTLKDSGIRRISDLRGKIVGVIHLAYPLGGGAQQRLLESASLLADQTPVVPLGTAKEVIHHLFAGTIDAAGLPEGEAEEVLEHLGHMDAISEIRVIKEFKFPTARYTLFIREDLLSPIPPFAVMIANVLSGLYPPGATLRETKKQETSASATQPAPGVDKIQ